MYIKFSSENSNKPNKYGFLTKTIVLTLAIIIASYVLPGVHVQNIFIAIITAIVISLLNNFIRPILIVLTLPFTVITMGIFLLVINAVIILLTSKIIPQFHVDGFWTAFWFSLLITFLSYLFDIPNKMLNRKKYDENNSFSQSQSEKDEHFDDYEDVTGEK